MGLRTQHAHPWAGSLTIVELQDLVIDGRGHANGLAREVGVEVQAFSQQHPGGGLTVAGEQGEDIVLATMPRTRPTLPQPLAQAGPPCPPPTSQTAGYLARTM